jgi:hypothetical protein
VRLGPHRLVLRPRVGADLRIESSKLETIPPANIRWVRDAYDNSVAIATFDATTAQLDISSEVIVQHYGESPLDFLVSEFAINYPFTYDADSAAVLQPYLVCPGPADHAALGT